MPTGSGKSAIYQMAGLLLPGPTIVVSPLIALQHDQVESLHDHALEGGAAAQLNSTLSATERRDVLRRLHDGRLEFCFLAPEQLTRQDTLDAQYTLTLAAQRAPKLTFGVINATDEDPPTVHTSGGYDSKVHDPRGRMVYAKALFRF